MQTEAAIITTVLPVEKLLMLNIISLMHSFQLLPTVSNQCRIKSEGEVNV